LDAAAANLGTARGPVVVLSAAIVDRCADCDCVRLDRLGAAAAYDGPGCTAVDILDTAANPSAGIAPDHNLRTTDSYR
jgi:hypothetical protein